VAANLLRLSYWKPLRVVLVDRAPSMARGAAYADRPYPYLLNVPAGRMSANSREPLEFLAFAQRKLPGAAAEDFLPRALYGEYLESMLLEAEVSSPPHVTLERVRGDACSLERTGSVTSPFRLLFTDGRTLAADDVVLALGNPPPARLPGTEALVGSPHYVDDPWRASSEFQPGETVLAVGTGLTMADVVVAGTHQARDQVVVHALSRHGLVPPTQTAFRHRHCEGDSGALLRAASSSARRLVRSVRDLSTEMEHQGGDWREAITFVRNLAPVIWQRLPTRERRRFLRHARSYWDIHRHRLPQETLAAINQLRLREKLHVHAGRLVALDPIGGRVRVTWRPRGATEAATLFVDRVFNCTGPDYNPRRSRDPLLRSLMSQGLVTSDSLGLGLRTGSYGTLVDAHGRTTNNLYYIGPMLRADHWESTAAPELRSHAERLAHHLAAPAVRQFATR
jgi:uncharacterized NAD(P)/FAD-binding protein YdhS